MCMYTISNKTDFYVFIYIYSLCIYILLRCGKKGGQQPAECLNAFLREKFFFSFVSFRVGSEGSNLFKPAGSRQFQLFFFSFFV